MPRSTIHAPFVLCAFFQAWVDPVAAQNKPAIVPETIVYDEAKQGDFGPAKYDAKPAVRLTERGVSVIKGSGVDNVDDVDAFVFEVAGGKEFDFSLIADAAEFKKIRSIAADGSVKEVGFGSSNLSFRAPRHIFVKGLAPGRYHVEMYFGPNGASGDWIAKIAVRGDGEAPDENFFKEPPLLSSAEKMAHVDWPGAVSIFHGQNWGADDKFPIAIRELGYGATGAAEGQIPECKRHGLRAYVFIWAHEASIIPKKHKDDPTVLCYYLSDRIKPSQWGAWATMENFAYAGDPKHPAMFTMNADWGAFDLFCPIVRGRAMEYYHYDWDAKRRPHMRYAMLDLARQSSLKHGDVPVCRIIEVRPEDMRKTRHTVFTSLAYGVRGYRMGGTIFDVKNRDERGVPTPNAFGKEIKNLNAAINACSPIFASHRSEAVWHTAPLPPGCVAAPKDSWVSIDGKDALVGVFRDKKSPAEAPDYLVVANRDAFARQPASISVAGKIASFDRLDRSTGRWEPLSTKIVDERTVVSLDLDEGSGEIVRVRRK